MQRLVCLDVGSTWTKGTLVSAGGELLGTGSQLTSLPEVLDGVAAVTNDLGAGDAEVLCCSSAGGGLRLAVLGQERLVSAEAGHRVALSAGAKVVHVAAGELDGTGVRALRASRPDVLLLVGGTDGGDEKVLLHNAKRLAVNRVRTPIVLAGNTAARARALAILGATDRVVIATENVLPDIGELYPDGARAAIRSMFLEHVIASKGLSRTHRFRELVRTVTPDAVLTGVARLATASAVANVGAVLVVDVGGATTDVYSAVSTMDSTHRAVALPADRRTVEGDVGMRSSAAGVAESAADERLIDDAAHEQLTAAARLRTAHVDFVPTTAEESTMDTRIAALASVLAIRRHVRLVDGQLGPHGAGLLILSGGVFRHADPARLDEVRLALREDPVLRPILRTAEIVVDRRGALAPAGLLAGSGRIGAADALLRANLTSAARFAQR